MRDPRSCGSGSDRGGTAAGRAVRGDMERRLSPERTCCRATQMGDAFTLELALPIGFAASGDRSGTSGQGAHRGIGPGRLAGLRKPESERRVDRERLGVADAEGDTSVRNQYSLLAVWGRALAGHNC